MLTAQRPHDYKNRALGNCSHPSAKWNWQSNLSTISVLTNKSLHWNLVHSRYLWTVACNQCPQASPHQPSPARTRPFHSQSDPFWFFFFSHGACSQARNAHKGVQNALVSFGVAYEEIWKIHVCMQAWIMLYFEKSFSQAQIALLIINLVQFSYFTSNILIHLPTFFWRNKAWDFHRDFAIPIKCFVSHYPTDPFFWKSEKKNLPREARSEYSNKKHISLSFIRKKLFLRFLCCTFSL